MAIDDKKFKDVTLQSWIKQSQQNGFKKSTTIDLSVGKLLIDVRNGKAFFYYRYTAADGSRHKYPIGHFGKIGDWQETGREIPLTLALARVVGERTVVRNDKAMAEGFNGVKEYDAFQREEKARQRELDAVKREKERQAELDLKKHTLRALLNVYVQELKDNGQGAWKDAANLFKNWVFNTPYADIPASQLTAHNAAAIISPCRDKTTRQYQKLTSYMQAAFTKAINARDDPWTPKAYQPFNVTMMPIIKPPEVKKKIKRKRTLSHEELQYVLPKLRARDSYKSDIVLLFLLTGVRLGQFLRCELIDFDEKRRLLRVKDLKTGKYALDYAEHILFLEGEAFDIVKYFADYSTDIGSPYVFSTHPDNHIQQGTISRYFLKFSHELGFPTKNEKGERIDTGGFRVNDIRHTVVTEWQRMGINKEIRTAAMSHEKEMGISSDYSHWEYEQEIRTTYRRWEAELKRIESGESLDNVVPLHA